MRLATTSQPSSLSQEDLESLGRFLDALAVYDEAFAALIRTVPLIKVDIPTEGRLELITHLLRGTGKAPTDAVLDAVVRDLDMATPKGASTAEIVRYIETLKIAAREAEHITPALVHDCFPRTQWLLFDPKTIAGETPRRILEKLLVLFPGATIKQIVSPSRKRKDGTVRARHLLMWLMTKLMPTDLATIGDVFGGRDHTTVINARDAMEALLGSEAAERDSLLERAKAVLSGRENK